MANLSITWRKCGDDNHWCDFQNVDLSKDHFNELKGVYIIWSSGSDVIRIGSGIIKDRIKDHRDDKKINTYKNLLVTWAKVNANQMQGVEKFLADTYNPKVGERFPDRASKSVNLPW